jgi:uncharacterized phiE125 gp8 family phage protein
MSAPSIEPLTRTEAKNHLRVDSDLTADDTLIDMLIGAARRYAESYCGLSLITQGWRLVLDSFPGNTIMGVPWGTPYSLPGNAVLLERGPVTAVTSITYTAMDFSAQTMPSTDYVTDLTGPLPRITPVFGKIWPIPVPQIGAVQVNYTAGFGATAASVPEGIRQWMLLRITTLYRNREEVAAMGRGKVDPLPYVDNLLNPYRVVVL